jgi:hypothetical protein
MKINGFITKQEKAPRFAAGCLVLLTTWSILCSAVMASVQIKSADTKTGYIARLLLNEAPLPSERGWVSEENSKATMLAILWVCHSRIHHIPTGYKQMEIAAVQSKDIIDIITAGGKKGQCDGFYKDSAGHPHYESRVQERIDYLLKIANQGKPGKFARLVNYAQGLADAYVAGGMSEADRFAGLTVVGSTSVTGRAYSWMTDMDYYNPGGNFVRIPDNLNGSLGGNRFFTLRRLDI